MTTPQLQEVDTGPRLDLPAVLIALGAAVISYGVAVALLIAFRTDSATAGLAQYLVSGLAPIVAVGVAWAVRVRSFEAVGLRAVPRRWVIVAIGAGVGTVLLGIAVSIVVIVLTGPGADVQADYRAASSAGPLLLVLTLFAGAVLTPVGEELLFRGVLANWLLRFGGWVAVPTSAALFALAHGITAVLPVAFVVGIITALLFRATRSIWPGVIVHAINNGYAVIVGALAVGATS